MALDLVTNRASSPRHFLGRSGGGHGLLFPEYGFRRIIVRLSVWFSFFFQAEDGIRDSSVTGVQTCALPIWSIAAAGKAVSAAHHRRQPGGATDQPRVCRRDGPPGSTKKRIGHRASDRRTR